VATLQPLPALLLAPVLGRTIFYISLLHIYAYMAILTHIDALQQTEQDMSAIAQDLLELMYLLSRGWPVEPMLRAYAMNLIGPGVADMRLGC
jgi:hypothetical protein